MELREMAEAHLRNVQGQIQELQTQRERIDADIQQLSDYLQQGVAELNSGNNQTGTIDRSGATPAVPLSPPSVSLPGQSKGEVV